MTVTLIVLSRADDDGRPLRRAQLDLLLRSRAQHWPESRLVVVDQPAGRGFSYQVHIWIERCRGQLVAFATDDGVFHRTIVTPRLDDPRTLCWSLRLGDRTTTCYPTGEPQTPTFHWNGGQGDYGYPGSVDGNVFRADDLALMLDGLYVDNPTALEVILDGRCRELFAASRPLMGRFALPCYTAVPVNRVSSQSNVRSGTMFPQSVEELNARFDAGDRIDLEATFRDAVIDAAHVELPYRWESERAA